MIDCPIVFFLMVERGICNLYKYRFDSVPFA